MAERDRLGIAPTKMAAHIETEHPTWHPEPDLDQRGTVEP